MTDNEIIKALECCGRESCLSCPYRDGKCHQGNPMIRDARDLINRQQAEIERLQKAHRLNLLIQLDIAEKIKSEAIKEFAERFKRIAGIYQKDTYVIGVDEFDNLVKEMVGEKMTDRERLIDLIISADISLWGTDKPYAEVYADHLLANGVIVPPCKVGDTVYFDTYLRGDSIGVRPHKVIEVKCVIMTEPSKGGIGAEIPDWAFGESVFLTREEAEKALKERKNNV